MKNIIDFKNSQLYEDILSSIMKDFSIKIIYDEPSLVHYDEDMLIDSNITLIEIENMFKNNAEHFKNFSSQKIKIFFNREHEEEYCFNEYPELEDIEFSINPDENFYHETTQYSDEVSLGISDSFLLLYAIEFILLSRSINELENYLKIIRMPYSKAYAEELLAIHNSTTI